MKRMKHLKGHCQACGGHIEFPAEGIGTTAECPHCSQATELLLAAPPEEPTIPRRTIIWTGVTVLLLLLGLGGAILALKCASASGRTGRARHQRIHRFGCDLAEEPRQLRSLCGGNAD